MLQFYIYIKRIKLYRETRGTYIDTSGREEREIKKIKSSIQLYLAIAKFGDEKIPSPLRAEGVLAS